MTTSLSFIEKQEIYALGITITDLNKRLEIVKKRARTRNAPIPDRIAFYREFIKQLVTMGEKLSVTPKELMSLVQIHSDNHFDYENFTLMPDKTHRDVHLAFKAREAMEIRKKDSVTCNHCLEEKSLTEFPPTKYTLLGIVKTCRACTNLRAKQRSEVKENQDEC